MKTFLHEGICPIRDILSRLGDKWSLLVLTTLYSNGTMRFNDIQRSLGDISQRMLTVTLRSLEADGLVHREVYPEVPAPCRVSFDRFRGRSDAVSEQSGGVGVEEHAGHFGTACAGGAGEVICRRYKTSGLQRARMPCCKHLFIGRGGFSYKLSPKSLRNFSIRRAGQSVVGSRPPMKKRSTGGS